MKHRRKKEVIPGQARPSDNTDVSKNMNLLKSTFILTQGRANEADALSLYVRVIHPIKGLHVAMALKSGTRDPTLNTLKAEQRYRRLTCKRANRVWWTRSQLRDQRDANARKRMILRRLRYIKMRASLITQKQLQRKETQGKKEARYRPAEEVQVRQSWQCRQERLCH